MNLPKEHPYLPTKKDRNTFGKPRNTRFYKMVRYKKIFERVSVQQESYKVNPIIWQCT